jgi:hypothetical protein
MAQSPIKRTRVIRTRVLALAGSVGWRPIPFGPDGARHEHASAENCHSLEARTPIQLTGVRAGKLGARTAKPPAVAQIISQSSGRKISLQFVEGRRVQ